MNSRKWDKISKEAKDLILGLLKPCEQRMTIVEALNHPWFLS